MNRFKLQQQEPEKHRKLKKFNNRILGHALLAVVSIILTVVLIFPMAAAWYSNVVEVGSVQIQAKPWGFKGAVTVSQALISAAPGDHGVVTMSVTNPSDSVIAMTVGANKSTMPVEMQQRIYFYVDSAQVRNGETVQRRYLNANVGQDYTLMPDRTLSMSPEYSNVAPVNWMWVYDLLGYYVQGQWDENGKFVAAEYLRPVEYNYDKAVFDEATGQLRFVEFTTPVEDFIAELTAEDGYAGTAQIDEEHPGWYRISVDDKGKGVWLRLCDHSEIAAANAYDTALGEKAYEDVAAGSTPDVYSASVFVTGQQKELVTQQAANAEVLTEILTSGSADRVELMTDTTLPATVVLAQGSSVILDLNGHTLSVETGDVLEATEGTTLILSNGTVVGDGKTSYGVRATGADVTLDNVAMEQVNRGISIYDNKGSGSDSQIRVSGCTINATAYGAVIMGNGNTTAGRTLVVIEDSVIRTEGIGIIGNGTEAQGGVEIVIRGSEIVGNNAGVYHPQRDSVMTIVDSKITGGTGILVKAGTIHVDNSTINGTGVAFDPVEGGSSGSYNTADGIYMECNYGTPITVTISGDSVITSAENAAIRKFEADAANGTFVITGGTFTGVEAVDIQQFVPEGYVVTGNNSTSIQVTKSEESDTPQE